MSWSNPTSPNLPDFILFCQNSMGINALFLPTDSPFYGYAFGQAMELVIRMPCGGVGYTLAVYNCGGHILLEIAPDQDGRSFFQEQRKKFDLLTFAAGLVQTTSDAGTSTVLATSDALRDLTISDLGFMKTPWGRHYVAYNQSFGDIWGLT